MNACWHSCRSSKEETLFPRQTAPYAPTIFFGALALVFLAHGAFIVLGLSEKHARDEVQTLLNSLDVAQTRIWIAGKPVDDTVEMLRALKSMRHVSAHHSGPLHKLPVTVASATTQFDLAVARDSQIDDEYWVFYPEGAFGTSWCIARIKTRIFERYQPLGASAREPG